MDINKNVYSDGEIEDILIETLKEKKDVFSISYNGGAIFHNFTNSRENLVNWYPFRPDTSVLEIGAGMGALTGVLCKRCAHVTAFEQSPKRAEIIQLRYQDIENLEVVCGDITCYEFQKKYDYILLIGVLEYVGVGTEASNPYLDLLFYLNNLLTENGVLLIAIENRFGLKYWCGAAEDHTSIPFDGISGYIKQGYTTRYHDKGVCTFSREKLSRLLDESGFLYRRWYYPLPDYKFPMAVFTDEYLPTVEDIKSIKFSYSVESELIADEKELYGEVIANKTFPFFANSFLIETGKKELSEKYIKYASFKRDYKDEYRISTQINNMKEVIKESISDVSQKHLEEVYENTIELKNKVIPIVETIWSKKSLIQKWQDLRRADTVVQDFLKDNDLRGILALLDILKKDLEKASVIYKASSCFVEDKIELKFQHQEEILAEGYIDMTFANSFVDGNILRYFDQEWKLSNIPIKYVLYRAIKYSYQANGTVISITDLYKYAGVNEELIKLFNFLEEQLLCGMMNKQNCDVFDPAMFHGGLTKEYKEQIKEKQIELLQEEKTKLNQQYNEMSTSYEQLLKEYQEMNTSYEQLLKEYQEIDGLYKTKCDEWSIERKKTETNYSAKINKLQTELNNCKKLHAEIDNCNTMLSEYENKIQDLNQTILNKEGHIEQLLEVEREYEREKTSRTYRLALRFRRLSVMLLPVNSKRRFFFKILKKGLRHPGLMLKMINPRRVKNCFTILKTEGIDSAVNHYRLVEEYEKSRTVPLEQNNLEVIKVQEEPKHIEDYVPLSFTEFESPEISIIIPVYNQFDYTYHCLEAILNNSESWQYEVIIADDCSSDLTTNLNEVVAGVKIIHNKENLHFLLNCNNAAKQASGKYIVFLNNDTQVQKDWLTYLVALMRQDSSIGMVGAKLLYADGYLQEAGGIIWKDASAWNYGNRQNPNDSEFNYVHEADYISGAAIMIRTFLWKEIGGFDESFVPAYCEDSDLAFEVRKHGYKVIYQPKSVVVHFEGISNGTDLTTGQKKYQVENQKKFYEKWKDELEKNHFGNGTELFVARDRSQKKKHVLVIDHYVPQYDKDAGSKTTFMYLKMLVSKGYKITFLGDNFYQHEPYTTELQQMGIFVLYGPKYAENWKAWLQENINYFDIFYLNRPHITIKYIDFIKENTNKKIIYYGHDLHFLRIRREYELSGNQKTADEAERWLKQELSIMRKADMNYYPSVIEKDEIHKMDSSIPVKAITAYVYEKFREVRYIPDKRKGLLFVGGFGHDPNLDAVLWFLEKIYPKVYEKTNAPFYIVGSKAPDSILQIRTPGVVVKGFVSEEELQMLYDTSRIAVVPLRYGAGVKGKVVEALYYGIPIVTTSVGAEGIEGIKNIAIIQDQEEEIIETICELYQNPDKLSEMSAHSQRFVREKFSTEAVWNIIKDDFDTGKEI